AIDLILTGWLSTRSRLRLQSANAQVVLQFLQAGVVSTDEELHLSFVRRQARIILVDLPTERPHLPFACVQLCRENTNLTAESLDFLVDLDQAPLAGRGSAFCASIRLVKRSCQRDEASHRENN